MKFSKSTIPIILTIALILCMAPLTTASAVDKITMTQLTSTAYDFAGEFKNGYAFAVSGKTAGYLDKSGIFHGCYSLPNDLSSDYTYADYLKDMRVVFNISEEGLYPFYDSTVKKWGAKDFNSEKIVIPAQYANPTVYRYGRAVVQECDAETGANKYIVFDTKGNVVFKGTGYVSDYYVNGVISAEIGVSDREASFSKGQAKTQLVELGVYDINGKLLHKYDCFYGGLCESVFIADMKECYYDPATDMLEEGALLALPSINNSGEITVTYCKPDGTTLFTVSGNKYWTDNWVSKYREGFACYQDTDTELYGVMDLKGNKIIPAQYSDISYCFNGYFWLQNSKEEICIADTKGNTIIPFGYTKANRPGKNDVALEKNGKWGLVDYNNKILLPFIYDYLSSSFDGVVIFKENGLFGYMTLDGAKLTQAIFDVPYTTEEGVIMVQTASKYEFFKLNTPAAASNVAYSGKTSVKVDGKDVTFNLYALKDANGNLTNYVKLRDVAYILNGSKAQFNVGWANNAINLETRKDYTTPNGSEMSSPFSGDQLYADCSSKIYVDGNLADLKAITLTDSSGGSHNYFKLRDIGKAMGYNVTWDDTISKIIINTNEAYSG